MKQILLTIAIAISMSSNLFAQQVYFDPETIVKNIKSLELESSRLHEVKNFYLQELDEFDKISPIGIKKVCLNAKLTEQQSKKFFDSFFPIPTQPQGYYYASSGTISYLISENGEFSYFRSDVKLDAERYKAQFPLIKEAIARINGYSLEDFTLQLEASCVLDHLNVLELLIEKINRNEEVENMYAFFLRVPYFLAAKGLFLNDSGRLEITRKALSQPLYKTEKQASEAFRLKQLNEFETFKKQAGW